jgi:hypothetical protein
MQKAILIIFRTSFDAEITIPFLNVDYNTVSEMV